MDTRLSLAPKMNDYYETIAGFLKWWDTDLHYRTIYNGYMISCHRGGIDTFYLYHIEKMSKILELNNHLPLKNSAEYRTIESVLEEIDNE